jgi:hypothetical protein
VPPRTGCPFQRAGERGTNSSIPSVTGSFAARTSLSLGRLPVPKGLADKLGALTLINIGDDED